MALGLPSDESAEEACLGAVLLRGAEALDDLREWLNAEDFGSVRNVAIFKAMCTLADREQAIDLVTIESQLRATRELTLVGGIEAVAKLGDRYATSHNLRYHARLVRDAASLRRLHLLGRELAEESAGGVEDVPAFLDQAERSVLAVADRGRPSHVLPARELVVSTVQRIVARSTGDDVGAVKTGWAAVDKMANGFGSPGELTLVAARPSMGKTGWAVSLARQIALPRTPSDKRPLTPVLFFSLEMDRERLLERVIAAHGDLPLEKLVGSGHVWLEDDFRRLTAAAECINSGRLHLDDSAALTSLQMRSRARRWIRAERRASGDPSEIGVIIVDYLQLARGGGQFQTREQEVSSISRELKGTAKITGCHVVALSQLNRAVETRANHRPMLSDLRESGALEQDADRIVFLVRREYYQTPETPVAEREAWAFKGEVIFAKQRNGATGDVILRWEGSRARYVSFTHAAPTGNLRVL